MWWRSLSDTLIDEPEPMRDDQPAETIELPPSIDALFRHRLLSADEERALFARFKAGDIEARDEIAACNMRLVAQHALKQRGRGIEFEDLVMEGSIGLMTAINRFEPSRELRFSTYATWWIRQAITRAIANDGRIIRVPVHLHDQITKLKRVSAELDMQLCRRATPAEIAEHLGVSTDKVVTLMQQSLDAESLDKPIERTDRGVADRGGELHMFLADPNANVEEQGETSLLRDQLNAALGRLRPRLRQVIVLRYGLDQGGIGRTLEEVGQHFGGISRERIRQLEAEALRKLRHPVIGRGLRGFLEGAP